MKVPIRTSANRSFKPAISLCYFLTIAVNDNIVSIPFKWIIKVFFSSSMCQNSNANRYSPAVRLITPPCGVPFVLSAMLPSACFYSCFTIVQRIATPTYHACAASSKCINLRMVDVIKEPFNVHIYYPSIFDTVVLTLLQRMMDASLCQDDIQMNY